MTFTPYQLYLYLTILLAVIDSSQSVLTTRGLILPFIIIIIVFKVLHPSSLLSLRIAEVWKVELELQSWDITSIKRDCLAIKLYPLAMAFVKYWNIIQLTAKSNASRLSVRLLSAYQAPTGKVKYQSVW